MKKEPDNRKCTIYLLTNKVNGKVYIGQTWNKMQSRIGTYGEGYASSRYLYFAIQKYGVENFEYAKISEADTQEEADQLEAENIIKYDSRNPDIGYNLKEGGSAGKHSEENHLQGKSFGTRNRKIPNNLNSITY